jgi:hypothetical protein
MRTLIRHFQGAVHAITPNNGNRRVLKNAHWPRRKPDPLDPDQTQAIDRIPQRPYEEPPP